MIIGRNCDGDHYLRKLKKERPGQILSRFPGKIPLPETVVYPEISGQKRGEKAQALRKRFRENEISGFFFQASPVISDPACHLRQIFSGDFQAPVTSSFARSLLSAEDLTKRQAAQASGITETERPRNKQAGTLSPKTLLMGYNGLCLKNKLRESSYGTLLRSYRQQNHLRLLFHGKRGGQGSPVLDCAGSG